MEEIFRYYAYVCISRERYITLGILYGYKALLQIMALIFAVSIRKVHIKGLNNAVYVIAAIYVSSIVTAVIVVSTYTLTDFINVYATVFCLCFFIGTTVILGLVFIPPVSTLCSCVSASIMLSPIKVLFLNDARLHNRAIRMPYITKSVNQIAQKNRAIRMPYNIF